MIKSGAHLTIARIPLECLQVKMRRHRFLDCVQSYMAVMKEHPTSDVLLNVTPSDTHPGMYAILDGHHRFIASLMTGRKDALCVVVEEEA